MKLFVKSKKMLVILALVIGIFSFVLLNNNKKVEDKTIYKDGIKMLDYNQVQVGENAISGTDKVKFDAFFLEANSNSEEADRYRGKSINVSSSAKLWLELQINGGATLKDAYIEFQNSNARIEGAIAKDTVIKDTIVSNNITRIPLNEVNVGTTKMFYLNVTPNLTNNIKSYNGTNKVILKGTVVENDTETEIEKEVEYLVNFYGTEDSIKGETFHLNSSAPMVEYGSDETVTVTYNVNLKETKDLMLIKSTNIESQIGKLNGFDPLSVRVDGAEFEYEYDENTNRLTAKREAVVENDRITKQAYAYKEAINKNNGNNYYSVDSSTGIVKANEGTYSDPNNINNSSYRKVNEITITVVYPNEASYKTGTAVANLNLWYEAFNNEELTDAVTLSKKVNQTLIANYQCDDTKGTISTVFTRVVINKDTKINNEESLVDSTPVSNKYKNVENGNIRYDIDIAPYIGGYNPAYEIGGLTIYDLGSNYMNQTTSMKEFEKYYSIRLSSDIIKYIGQQGSVKVIDADTNEIVHVFDKDNYNETYIFETDVRSIKLEISDISDFEAVLAGLNNELFNIRLTKEIDVDYVVNNYTYDEFEEWNHIYTTIRTDWTAGEYTSENDIENIADSQGRRVQRVSALFSEGLSKVELTVDTTDTVNRLRIHIDTDNITRLYKGYKNGEFIIELPEAILDYDVVEDSINGFNYEMLEINGHKLLKIIKENEYAERYNFSFDIDVIPDVRVVNQTVYYKLYAYNPNCHNYDGIARDIYDVNNNGNTDEYVGYASSAMNLIAPSEVITAASLVDYNTNNDITVSPMIAEVDPVKDNGNAKVNIYVINNSGYAIKDTKVIGKLAFIGNKNQIDNTDLNSEFDVHMTDAGITYPSELDGYVTIYYSESENPTDVISDTNNGWTETPTDFSNVKTYMIVIDDYEIANQENITFEYNITMPTDTDNMFKKSYFTHGVYYKLVTEDGLVPLNVGATKLGVTMVRKYDLNIDTLRKGTDKEVDLVTYELEDEDGEIITILPKASGLEVKGLYVGKPYKLKQKTISNNYEIDSEEKTFEIVNGANDDLEINTTGTYKSSELNNNILNLTFENRPRYTIVVKLSDLDTDENISGGKFKLTGKGYESGTTLMTNVNGELTFKNIYLDEFYNLSQIFSPKHYYLTSSYILVLGYDDETGEVKFKVSKVPLFTGVTATNDSTSNFTSNSNSNVINLQSTSTGSSTRSKGYLELDLTDYSNDYTLNFYSTSYRYRYGTPVTSQIGTVNIYVTDYLVSSINELTSANVSPSVNYYQSDLYNSSTLNSNVSEATTRAGAKVPIKGGKKYYVYVDQYSNNSSIPMSSVRISTSGSEYLKVNDQSIVLYDYTNYRADEILNNNINDIQPLLIVNTKNKAIPTANLKIIKKDVDTNEVLPNALYRLSGPGITDSVILTTDENGEAEHEIYLDYNTYTLKEISAPSGYAINPNEIKFNIYQNMVFPVGVSYTPENVIEGTSYDSNTNTYNMDLYDYPLVKVRKTDDETGELLPNTMFAIYKTARDDGHETLSEAIDVNGNIVGEEIEIDGETYRVITTNERGEITLNLEKGQYKLKEVQASSEKYEISKQVYYFGVGESIPYQAAGLNFVDAYQIQTNMIPANSWGNNFSAYKLTNDGGFIIKDSSSYMAKYDKNGVIEWDYQTANLDQNIDQCFGSLEVTVNYPDKESQTYDACIFFSTIYDVFSTKNGDIFVSGDIEFKINGITYVTSIAIPYIRLNSDGSIDSSYKVSIDFTGRGDITSQSIINQLNQTDDANQIYYGQSGSFKTNSGIVKINGFEYYNPGDNYNGGMYSYFTSSNIRAFAITNDGEYYILAYSPVRLFKFDSNGNFAGFKNVNDEIQTIYSQQIYIQSTDGAGGVATNLDIDNDGNLLFTGAFNQNNYSELRIKYDKDLNLIYAKPVFYNETDSPTVRNYIMQFQQPIIQLKDDGGYYFYAMQYPYRSDANSISSFFGDIFTSDDYFDIEQQDMQAQNYYILEYDKDGKAVNAVNIGRRDLDHLYPETNPYVIKNMEYYTSNPYLSVIPYEDGFLISSRYSSSSYSNSLVLASGEKIAITGNYIIYKVNKDSRVEWIKQFNVSDRYSYGFMYRDLDGTIRLFFKNPMTITDLNGNNLASEASNVYVFEPSAEVLAAGPEAYTLEITNKAKEFDIKVVSDEGSQVTITKEDNTSITSDGEIISEKVTYDENTANDITITLKPNYVLKSVKLNDKPFTYQVNNDGTITLDKIPNVKENKTIEIETEEGLLSVTVHHYLENTTERVASDEILIGNPNDYYDALPFVSNLYSLITDEAGNYIMPDNHHMKFNEATGDVIFYYRENDVELNVNYYIDNTEDELAPTIVEKKLLGSNYTTEPLDIDFYRVSRVLGDESGILSQDKTVVTYFYQEVASTLTIKHLDINTREEVAPTETREIRLNEQYETNASNLIPVNYRNVSKTNNANDIATTENIEVIYYYDIIPFNVSVDKRIESITINGENINISDSKSTKISATKEDEVIVYYEIELKNNGDIKALFKVAEEDVNNFEIYDLGEFTETNEGYILEEELEPGESKTYRIGYKWNQGKYGISTNEVEINDVSNELGFDEPDSSDNKSITAILIEDKDVLGEKDFNPNTSDNIYKSIIIFILSMYGLLFMTFMYMIKKKFER